MEPMGHNTWHLLHGQSEEAVTILPGSAYYKEATMQPVENCVSKLLQHFIFTKMNF